MPWYTSAMYLSWFWIAIIAAVIWQLGYNSGKNNGRDELIEELKDRNINTEDL